MKSLTPIQEYALWTAAGISPDLLGTLDFGSACHSTDASSVGHGTAEPVALTQIEDLALMKLGKRHCAALFRRGAVPSGKTKHTSPTTTLRVLNCSGLNDVG